MDKKKLKKDVVARLNEGYTKNEVYEELIPLYGDRKEIARMLKWTPSPSQISRAEGKTIAMMVIVFLTTFFDVLLFFEMFI